MIEMTASKSFAEGREAGRCSDGALPVAPKRREGGLPRRAFEDASTQRGGYSARAGYTARAGYGARAGYSAPGLFGHRLVWLNLVCLDAPLVAISWQWLFAKAFDVPVNTASRAALFLTAWLIYLADRRGDASTLESGAPTSLRQRFCFRHRKAWLTVIVIVGSADAWLIGTLLDSRTVAVGALIGGVALGYLILNHRRSEIWRALSLKEMLVGFLFATGVMVALVHGLTLDLLPVWVLFGGLCTLNCISIAVWERALDVAQGRVSLATVFQAIGRVVLPALLILAAGCFALALTAFGPRAVYRCLATSALLLAAAHWFENRSDPDRRTALADLVLLTPVLVWVADAF